MGGNVILLNIHGEVLYDVQLPGAIFVAPTITDLNQDGLADIIVSVFNKEEQSSAIFVLSGDSGRILYSFLLPARGIVSASITLASLRPQSSSSHLIIPTYEGHVYFVSMLDSSRRGAKVTGKDVCVQSLDVGGYLYAPVLLDDVTNDGHLDLLTTTLQGDLSLYSTNVPIRNRDVTNSWPRFRHPNGFAYSQLDIQIDWHDKQRLRYMHTQHSVNISVPFTITDSLCASASKCLNDNPHKKYVVSVYTSTNTLDPVFRAIYRYPGAYTASFHLPAPCRHVLLVAVENEHDVYVEDSVLINLTSDFHVWIKYFLLAPVVLFSGIVYLKTG